MKQKKTTNLAKRIHMYNSLWDQTVMVAILTNMLACVEVQAEMDGVNMEKVMKDFYEIHLKDYRKQAKENLMKVRK